MRRAALAAAGVALDVLAHGASVVVAVGLAASLPREFVVVTAAWVLVALLPVHGAVRGAVLDVLGDVGVGGDAPTAARDAAASALARLVAWWCLAGAALGAGGVVVTVAPDLAPRPRLLAALAVFPATAAWLLVAGPFALVRPGGALRSRLGRLRGSFTARPGRTAAAALTPGVVCALGVGTAFDVVRRGHAFGVEVGERPVIAAGVLAAAVVCARVAGPALGRLAAPATPAPVPSLGRRRVALAVLLVAGLVAGVGAVRVADVGADPAATADTPTSATYDRALSATLAADRRATVTADGDRRVRAWVDRSDRQALVRANFTDEPGFDAAVYVAEGTFAQEPPTGSYGGDRWLVVSGSSGGWYHAAVPGYTTERSDVTAASGAVDLREASWRRVAQRDGRTVLCATSVAGLHDSVPGPDRVRSSSARAVVDARTGHLVSVRVRWTTSEGSSERVVRFDRVGETDVERPAVLGDRRVAEVLWDAVVY